ncbi:condensation protein [Loktanella sp. D2R18]|uniref:condensation domain-containing protein n=1 Tax=Rhodobacterales TaxID=204455 RepID=UPI000DEB0852|nr:MULTISPECIES: condensation domain-containing protein [Rhodobacterales]MDO6592021.1 condensation domain-containing protein [Yoonia sp. 1_MG-2023]RBW44981.1 condensation protein [Loktanella sp. D2R18]
MSAQPHSAPWLDLTLAQFDFWEEFRLHPDRPLSTIAHCTSIAGPLNEAALIGALKQVAQETDVLALRFHDGPDGPRQQIDPARIPVVHYHDLTSETDPVAVGRMMMEADIAKPIDLEHDQISALWVLKVEGNRWLWYLRGHHIMLDGYGVSLIERRTAALYGQALGEPADLGAFQPFHRYLDEETSYRNSPHHTRNGDHWQQTLKDGPDLTVLEKGDEDYGCSSLSAAPDLPPELPTLLRQTAENHDIGWPDLLTLLSAAWLARDLDASDPNLPIWLPYMSRFGSISTEIPALVVNILPLIVTKIAGETLRDYLVRMGKVLRKLRRNGRYRVEQLAADHGLKEGQRFFFSPLINVTPFDPPRFTGCTAESEVLAAGPGDGFNLTWGSASNADGLGLWIDADPASKDQFTAGNTDLVPFIIRACAATAYNTPLDELLHHDASVVTTTTHNKPTPMRPIAGRLEDT